MTLLVVALTLFNIGMNNTGKVAWQAIPKMIVKTQFMPSPTGLFSNPKARQSPELESRQGSEPALTWSTGHYG